MFAWHLKNFSILYCIPLNLADKVSYKLLRFISKLGYSGSRVAFEDWFGPTPEAIPL